MRLIRRFCCWYCGFSVNGCSRSRFTQIGGFQNPFIRDLCRYIVHFADGFQFYLFCWRQVAIQSDQVVYLLDCLGPAKMNVRTVALLVVKSLSVVRFIAIRCSGKCRRMTADAILLFQKVSILLGRMRLSEILIDTGFPGGKAVAVGHGFRNFIVRDERQHLRYFGHGGIKVPARHGVLINQRIQLVNEAVSEAHQARRFLTGSTEILVLSQHGGQQIRISQCLGGSFYTGRMGCTAHSSESRHITLFAGSGRGVPIQIDHTFSHTAAFMPRSCRHFDVGGKPAFFQ